MPPFTSLLEMQASVPVLDINDPVRVAEFVIDWMTGWTASEAV
jgi:hypothetical protein